MTSVEYTLVDLNHDRREQVFTQNSRHLAVLKLAIIHTPDYTEFIQVLVKLFFFLLTDFPILELFQFFYFTAFPNLQHPPPQFF